MADEEQVHTIRVVKEDLSGIDTGGGCRQVDVVITVDSSSHPRQQQITCVHETLGVFIGAVVSSETLTEIATAIVDNLEELNEG